MLSVFELFIWTDKKEGFGKMQSSGNVQERDRSEDGSPNRKFNQIKQYRELGHIVRNVEKTKQMSVVLDKCLNHFGFPLSPKNQKTL
jgi:hypothetical protein